MQWFFLFLGGGLGAMLRALVSSWVDARHATGLPWGTLAVNAIGCLAIGALLEWAELRDWLTPNLRAFAVAGFLGGFTTFSTFGHDTWALAADGRVLPALANMGGSLLVGLVAVVLGVAAARALAT